MLLPVLKPATWDGIRSDARVHVWLGSPTEPMVIVAYAEGWDDRELTYMTTKSAYGASDEMVRDAFDNLAAYHTDFEVVEADGERMLVSGGGPMAAERALNQSHMLSAHQKLDDEEIVVSIARRGSLLACGRDVGAKARQTMVKLHAESYRAAVSGGEEIYGGLIVFREGVVSGLLDVVATADGEPFSWGPHPT